MLVDVMKLAVHLVCYAVVIGFGLRLGAALGTMIFGSRSDDA